MSIQKHYKSQILKNSLGKFKISKDIEIECYTKKQINALYPKKTCTFAGEYKCGNSEDKENCTADISVGNSSLYLNDYKSNSRIIYAEKGYLKCDDDTFIVLLKNTILKRIALLILFLFIAFSAGAALYNIYAFKNTIYNLLDVDQNATDWNENLNSESSQANNTKIPGFGSLTIPENKTDISISLGNPAENSCYFIISLYLEDGTQLFKSELIPPGKGLNKVTLSKALPHGNYNGIIAYQTFSLDTQKEMNGANLNIKIIVQ